MKWSIIQKKDLKCEGTTDCSNQTYHLLSPIIASEALVDPILVVKLRVHWPVSQSMLLLFFPKSLADYPKPSSNHYLPWWTEFNEAVILWAINHHNLVFLSGSVLWTEYWDRAANAWILSCSPNALTVVYEDNGVRAKSLRKSTLNSNGSRPGRQYQLHGCCEYQTLEW